MTSFFKKNYACQPGPQKDRKNFFPLVLSIKVVQNIFFRETYNAFTFLSLDARCVLVILFSKLLKVLSSIKKLVINHEVWVCWLSFKSEFWLQFWHQKVEQVYADDMFIEIGAKIYQNLHLYKGDIGPPTPRFSGPAL